MPADFRADLRTGVILLPLFPAPFSSLFLFLSLSVVRLPLRVKIVGVRTASGEDSVSFKFCGVVGGGGAGERSKERVREGEIEFKEGELIERDAGVRLDSILFEADGDDEDDEDDETQDWDIDARESGVAVCDGACTGVGWGLGLARGPMLSRR